MNQVQQQSASFFSIKNQGIGISLMDETDLGGPIIKTVFGFVIRFTRIIKIFYP